MVYGRVLEKNTQANFTKKQASAELVIYTTCTYVCNITKPQLFACYPEGEVSQSFSQFSQSVQQKFV